MLIFILALVPICLFSWAPWGYENTVDSIPCERIEYNTTFETNVHVEAGISYPVLPGTNALTKYVNESLKEDSHFQYDQYLQKMRIPQEEVWEDDLDREFQYSLYPIYCSPDLVSIYGSKYYYWNLPHGSLKYVSKIFWQKNGSIYQLKLSDLFLPKHKNLQFLLRYCEKYFKSRKSGYYAYEDPEWPKLRTDHLETFVLTEKGLLLIFQYYVVDGWNDDPITLLIAYSDLVPFMNPDGPLSALLRTNPEDP